MGDHYQPVESFWILDGDKLEKFGCACVCGERLLMRAYTTCPHCGRQYKLWACEVVREQADKEVTEEMVLKCSSADLTMAIKGAVFMQTMPHSMIQWILTSTSDPDMYILRLYKEMPS
jgi:hypothetical protein